jgi:sortase A
MGPRRLAVAAGTTLLLAGCTTGEPPVTAGAAERSSTSSSSSASESSTAAPTPRSTPTPTPTPTPTQAATPRPDRPSDGRPARAALSIPKLGIAGLVVVPHRGRPDDAEGTRIQDGGVAASPYGPRGGVGPGGVGNYIVTAHRLSSTQAFLHLPDLRRGDKVQVEARGKRYVYEIVGTRATSFRSETSRRAQEAAVPGRPGVEPTRAMITLSTCATPEDHAAGNYWSDEFGNPEHRIDKIGVLVRTVALG